MMLGKLTQSPVQSLEKININQLANLITTPPTGIQDLHYQLQSVLSLNHTRLAKIICRLPYVVMGVFNPPIAETPNFGYSNWLAKSIDNLSNHNLKVNELKKHLTSDPYITMMFTNPDRNGITVIFRLNSPCYDPNQYAVIWFAFMQEFYKANDIQKVINVTQADICNRFYLGWDKDIYINPQALAVDSHKYFNENSLYSFKQFTQKISKEKKEELTAATHGVLTDEQLIHIKQKLGIKSKLRKNQNEKQQRIQAFLDELTEKFKNNGLTITEIQQLSGVIKVFYRNANQINKLYKINIFFENNGIYFTHPIGENKPDEIATLILRQLTQKHL